jgi:hypothetical protein
MTNNGSIEPGSAPVLYMVAICIAMPQFTTEVEFLNFTMSGHSKEEAISQIRYLFTQQAYDSKTKSWNLGGIPIIPWHIFAVEYPKDLNDKISEELDRTPIPSEHGDPSSADADVPAKIFQLFPKKSQNPDDVPPDDPPPDKA